METRLFTQIWDQLRIKKSNLPNFLEQINIKNFRGISNLNVTFNYPVSVIAGPNASGKSTVLFACACAYRPLNLNPLNFTPASLFPNLKVSTENVSLTDMDFKTEFEFYYLIDEKKHSMRWAKGKSWNKSFMGKKRGKQPDINLYIRTLANLTSPSEIRSFLQISLSKNIEIEHITSDLIAFAQRILPYNYDTVSLVKKDNKDILFVKRNVDEKLNYSEFHMSAGERAVLRISKDISNLKNGLVLIDEIEAGLHPFTQEQLMLELQRIALRNNLQIIVTSHSPLVLESVPIEARIFLERTFDNVEKKSPYKNIIQKSLYGQTTEKLNLLCEDDMGEYFVLGILDYLNPKLNLIHDDIKVGRDTGKNEFKSHIIALGKFNRLNDFVFVLDADAKNLEDDLIKAASQAQPNANLTPLFLPGENIPESWGWMIISSNIEEYSRLFGINMQELSNKIEQQNSLYDNATDKASTKMKNKFSSFCETIRRDPHEIIRIISRNEVTKEKGEIKVFSDDLETQIRNWQNRK